MPEFGFNPESDVIMVDKPRRCTSFDIVNKIRHTVQRSVGHKVKVGHAGTLDPLASGLLIVCIGKMTKRISDMQSLPKEYEGTFRMGGTTASYDLEHPVDRVFPYRHITAAAAEDAARQFVGRIRQTPPSFSAVRIGGRRAYEIAREGDMADIKPKDIEIYDFRLTRFELPDIDFVINCSKGTYIRSMARDFGNALNSGACLTSLRRTRIGPYLVENAVKPLVVEDEKDDISGEIPANPIN